MSETPALREDLPVTRGLDDGVVRTLDDRVVQAEGITGDGEDDPLAERQRAFFGRHRVMTQDGGDQLEGVHRLLVGLVVTVSGTAVRATDPSSH